MKILTTGRLGRDFYTLMVKNDIGLQVRYVENLSQKDIEWADTLASFVPKDHVNLSSIKWIHSFGAGVEGFIARKDLNNNLVLSRTVGDLGAKMGEYCLCHILNFTQNYYQVYKNQLRKKWLPIYPDSPKNKTALLLGTGEMSKGIAKILKAFGIQLIGANTSGVSSEYFDDCVRFKEINSVSNKVDFVINTLPLTSGTKNLLDYKFFNLFKDILFINVGRGLTINLSDLQNAIENRNCKFAVLDVFEQEPLPENSQLWLNNRILITPHQAAITAINDIVSSFKSVLHSINRGNHNNLFVDLTKGY